MCSKCGSQLAMQYQDCQEAEITYISTTSLDSPDMFPPNHHIYWADRRPWLKVADNLPKYDQGTD
jgi:hypothetical protein